MSTFTNVLQQRINALENQIRNLQEQNNNLRRRARYLLEAAPSNDMLMVPDSSTTANPILGVSPDVFTGNQKLVGYNSPTSMYKGPKKPKKPGRGSLDQPTLGGVTIRQIVQNGTAVNGVYQWTHNGRTYYCDYPSNPCTVTVYDANGNMIATYSYEIDT
jgi:hypothetical protein